MYLFSQVKVNIHVSDIRLLVEIGASPLSSKHIRGDFEAVFAPPGKFCSARSPSLTLKERFRAHQYGKLRLAERGKRPPARK
jgi:hypothetical protein